MYLLLPLGRLSRPLNMLLMALTYVLGTGIARYLGFPAKLTVFWLGLLGVLLAQMTMGLLREVFRADAGLGNDGDAVGAGAGIREAALYTSIAALAACAIIAFILYKDGVFTPPLLRQRGGIAPAPACLRRSSPQAARQGIRGTAAGDQYRLPGAIDWISSPSRHVSSSAEYQRAAADSALARHILGSGLPLVRRRSQVHEGDVAAASRLGERRSACTMDCCWRPTSCWEPPLCLASLSHCWRRRF